MRLGLALVLVIVTLGLYISLLHMPLDGGDARAYYRGVYGPYGVRGGDTGYFQYTPAFWQAIAPLRLLPEPVFVVAWHVLLFSGYALSLGPFMPIALMQDVVVGDLWVGNIYGLTLLAVALSFRCPAAWAFMLLTKITPGIGVLWFAFRREWRQLGIALGVTAAIVVASFALDPARWADWFYWLRVNAEAGVPATTGGALHVPLGPRVVVGIVLLWIGARANIRSVVPVVVALTMPSLQTLSFSLLLLVLPLGAGDIARRLDLRDAQKRREVRARAAGSGVDRAGPGGRVGLDDVLVRGRRWRESNSAAGGVEAGARQ